MTAVHPVPAAFIVEQVRAVADDIGVDAVKIGMLGTAETVAAVDARSTCCAPGTPVVVDPVMVSESGAVLLDDAARARAGRRLLPRATVITPNLPEARVLAGDAAPEDAEALARALHALGPARSWCHRRPPRRGDGRALRRRRGHRIPGERHPDGAAHGSGCTHSSALAAHLALGATPLEAARAARRIAARGGPRRAARARRRARARSTSSARAAKAAPRVRCTARTSGHNRPMKFLRMRPGYGEQLIAEGDRTSRRSEQALVEEFRRQLDAGMWAAVPTASPAAAARREMVRAFDEIPRDTGRVIFFPRAAGARG